MRSTRRDFMIQSAAGMGGLLLAQRWAAAADAAAPTLRLSACDWSLRAKGPEGLATAKAIGLDGLELSAGDATDVLQIADPGVTAKYKEQMKATGVIASSVAMGFLNGAPFAEDPRGPAWLDQTIDATKDLDAKVILLAFFGKGDLRKGRELKADKIDVVVERLKDAAPKAKEAGVILGLENTLSGKDNLAILDRVKSDAVQVYYDVGNSTYNRYDVPAELRDLDDRICQIHLKDGGKYLGEGKVDMDAVAEAVADIDYQGWLVLETAIPSKDRDADFKKNAAYVRDLFKMNV